MKKIKLALLALLVNFTLTAQDDLLNELDSDVQIDKKVSSVFKGLKIINMESTKLAEKRISIL